MNKSPDAPERSVTPKDLERIISHCPRFLEERRRLSGIINIHNIDIRPTRFKLKAKTATIQKKLKELKRAWNSLHVDQNFSAN